MRRGWFSLPPILERTLRDDLKWAVSVLVGATAGCLLIGTDDPSLLVGFCVGCVVVIVVLQVLRRVLLSVLRDREDQRATPDGRSPANDPPDGSGEQASRPR